MPFWSLLRAVSFSAAMGLCYSRALPIGSNAGFLNDIQNITDEPVVLKISNDTYKKTSYNPYSLGIPVDGWSDTEGDFKLIMSGYNRPYGSPRDVNLHFYPHLVVWVADIVYEGGSERGMDTEWPERQLDHSFTGYNLKLSPAEDQPAQGQRTPFTVLEVIETLNIFQRWAVAWTGTYDIPSATMVVRSISKRKVIAQGRFSCGASIAGNKTIVQTD